MYNLYRNYLVVSKFTHSMEGLLTEEQIRTVAEQAREEVIEPDEDWPDCSDVSKKIRTDLLRRYDIDDHLAKYIEIKKYVLPDEYHHYALYLPDEILGEETIIDASYEQFSSDTDTPYNFSSGDDINNVIIVPETRYVFSQYEAV